jgi:hypothetical protein
MAISRNSRRTFRLAPIGAILAVTALMIAMPSVDGVTNTSLVTISSGNVDNTGLTPSIARFGNTYEAIWVARTGAKFAIQARILSAAGKPLGGVITAVGGWFGLEGDPTILADGHQRIIAFGGDRAGTTSPYDSGAEFYTTSTDGKHWSLSTGTLTDVADGADRSDGTAVVDDGGLIITALATGGHILLHRLTPDTSSATGVEQTSASTGTGTQEPGLAVDEKTHQVWTTWFSDSAGSDAGIHAQVIYPAVGPALRGPESTSPTGYYGAQRDVEAAARVGGGVYTAYATPLDHSIAVWKLGASRPSATVKDPTGVASIVVTPGPAGRIWLYWRDGNGWRADRSNKAVTRFGAPTAFLTPKSALEPNEGVGGVGVTGPLEAVGEYTTGSNVDVLFAKQVLPKLTVKASPRSVRRGHSFTVEVTDVGDAVKGATVRFGGARKKTNAKGNATFRVPGGTALGAHSVTFTMGGYVSAHTHVKIVR